MCIILKYALEKEILWKCDFHIVDIQPKSNFSGNLKQKEKLWKKMPAEEKIELCAISQNEDRMKSWTQKSSQL